MSLSLAEKHICSSYQEGMLKIVDDTNTNIESFTIYTSIVQYIPEIFYKICHIISRIRIKSILSLSSLTSKKFTRFFMNNNM